MGATNRTPNLDLPQFTDTDRPTWRGDINDAFNQIDTHAVTDLSADAIISALASNPETNTNSVLSTLVNSILGGGVAGLTKTVDARGVHTMARPTWAGVINWLVNVGEDTPLNALNTDIVEQVATTPVPWNPTFGVAGMAGWFSAKRSFTVAGAISSWPNLIQGNNNFIQPTAGQQPVVNLTKINGHPAVIADGVDDVMTWDCPDYTGPMTVYMVAGTEVADITGSSQFLVDARGATATSLRFGVFRTNTEAYSLTRGTAITSSASVWTVGAKFMRFTGNGANSDITVAGSSVASGSTPLGGVDVTQMSLFSRYDLAPANFANMYIGELIIVQGLVDSATDALIQSYLSREWT